MKSTPEFITKMQEKVEEIRLAQEEVNLASIKTVPDLKDSATYNILKKLWNGMDAKKRKSLLAKTTFSDKYAEVEFDDLTPAIQMGMFSGTGKI